MTKWTFQNVSKESNDRIPVRSVSHAVELLMEASGEFSQAPSVEFTHSERGAICITAGQASGVISFDPEYDTNAAHSLKGFKRVVPQASVADDLPTYIDACGASAIPSSYLIPITDLIEIFEFILEHHDYPPFADWKAGV